MKNYLIKTFVNTIGLVVSAHIVPGIQVENYATAIFAALVLALLNVFIKPFLILITLPINILSLGLFTLFINTCIFYVSSAFVEGFVIAGFWSAFLGALCLSVVSFILNTFVGTKNKFEFKYGSRKPQNTSDHGNVIEAEVVSSTEEKKQLL